MLNKRYKGRALAFSNTGTNSKNNAVDTKAVLYNSLCLPPLSEMEVIVKVKSDTISTDVCLIKAVALPRELPMNVANALVKPRESNKDITVPIRLINLLEDSVTLHKGSTVAYVTRLDPVSWQMLTHSSQESILMSYQV